MRRGLIKWPFGRGELLVLILFLVAGSLAILIMAPVDPAASGTQSAGLGKSVTQTALGPISASDIDLLVKVRQAGLWEIPTGQQADQRASSARVKEVGRQLVADHTQLDKEVRALAAKLGVSLPNEPNDDQKAWMAELSGKFGQEYDLAFAQLLRQAHGKVFTTVAAVRSGTKNEHIRAFAQKAVDVVMRHMTLLESTGLVDHNALPDAPDPANPQGV